MKAFNVPDKDDGDDDNDSDEVKRMVAVTLRRTGVQRRWRFLGVLGLYALLVVMALAMKAMAMRTMVIKAFNVPDTYCGDDDNDGDESEDFFDRDREEYRSTAALTLAQGCWSVRLTSCDGDVDK